MSVEDMEIACANEFSMVITEKWAISEGRRRRGWQRIKQLGGITEWTDMSLGKLQETVKDREVLCAAAHVVTKSQTLPSDWTTTK